MKLLLDTHVLLWCLSDESSLSPETYDLIIDPNNDVYVSAASIWEIGIKKVSGKLVAPDNLLEVIYLTDFILLSITPVHAIKAALLPPLHKDPFDRMLIAQTQLENMFLITCDSKILEYDVLIIKP